jgi:hypothetical protein
MTARSSLRRERSPLSSAVCMESVLRLASLEVTSVRQGRSSPRRLRSSARAPGSLPSLSVSCEGGRRTLSLRIGNWPPRA